MAEHINNNENHNNEAHNNGNAGFKNTVKSLCDGMDSFISAKTVLGDPVTIGDTTVIPLVDVSFGVGAGAFGKNANNNSGGAMRGKMTPSAVLVVKDGIARVVNVKDQDMLAKAMSVAPDVVDRVASFVKGTNKGSASTGFEEKVDKEIKKSKDKAEKEF